MPNYMTTKQKIAQIDRDRKKLVDRSPTGRKIGKIFAQMRRDLVKKQKEELKRKRKK